MSSASADWYDSDWEYRKQVTIDSAQVSSNLTNFPICINITDSDLASDAQSDGDDILFTDETDVQLNHEIEYWDDTTGRLIAWVNVTNLSGTDDTIIYMYYGNNACGNQESVHDTWNSNYEAVYHMSGSSYSDIDDSTSNNKDASNDVNTPSYEQTGIIHESVDFENSNYEYIFLSSNFPYISLDNVYSVEAWAKPDSFYSGSGASSRNCMLFARGSYYPFIFSFFEQGRFSVTFHGDDWSYHGCSSNETVVATDVWNYVAVSRNEGSQSLFVNGSIVNSTYDGSDANMDEPYAFYIGSHGTDYPTARYYDGLLDEIRFSSVALSDDWIEATYNSIINATDSDFFTIGIEETESESMEPASEHDMSEEEMKTFTLLVLFGLFFGWGYTVNKPSAGALLVVSGFLLLSTAFTLTSLYSLLGIPSIYILFMGFKKWLYFDEQDTKRKEQRPS